MRSIRENIQDHSFEVRTVRSVRKTNVRIFSPMDGTNWSIRALLYSHNQRPKPSPTSELNSVLNIFVSSLNAAVGREFFSSSSILFKVKCSLRKDRTCVKFFFVHVFCLLKKAFDLTVQYALWRSNTALDGPLIDQSNRVFLSSYTINLCSE